MKKSQGFTYNDHLDKHESCLEVDMVVVRQVVGPRSPCQQIDHHSAEDKESPLANCFHPESIVFKQLNLLSSVQLNDSHFSEVVYFFYFCWFKSYHL